MFLQKKKYKPKGGKLCEDNSAKVVKKIMKYRSQILDVLVNIMLQLKSQPELNMRNRLMELMQNKTCW